MSVPTAYGQSPELHLHAAQYTKIIWGYMGFAGFSIFFMLTGILAFQLIQLFHIPIDLFTFLLLLYNFAVSPAPLQHDAAYSRLSSALQSQCLAVSAVC